MPSERLAHKCVHPCTGCRVGIQHTHTRTHAVGGHPSFHTTARRRGAATDMASLCGGVGHWQACKAWWPWSAAQLLSMDSTFLVHAAVLWLPASHCAALCWCATHTHTHTRTHTLLLLLVTTTTTVQHHTHGAC